MNVRLLPNTGLNASKNLLPLFRLDVCNTSLATYNNGRLSDGDDVCKTDLHSDTANDGPPGLS